MASQAGSRAAGAVRHQLAAGTRRLVSHAPDARLERFFGSQRAQRAIFTRIASRFDPAKASGFAGSIVHELGLSDGTWTRWTIDVRDGRAVALPGSADQATLTLRLPLTGFVRGITSGASSFMPVLNGTMTLDGDLAVAARLGEMFGGPSTY